MMFFGCFYLIYLWLTPVIIVRLQDKFDITIILLPLLSLRRWKQFALRGYALKKLETAIDQRRAIYLTSPTFGLYHGVTLDIITGSAVWVLFMEE